MLYNIQRAEEWIKTQIETSKRERKEGDAYLEYLCNWDLDCKDGTLFRCLYGLLRMIKDCYELKYTHRHVKLDLRSSLDRLLSTT